MRLATFICAFALAGCQAQPRGAAEQRGDSLAAGKAFTCTPTHVWDGDGPIWCAEGPKVRLAGIAAREMDGTCRAGHPCPQASAEDAKEELALMLRGFDRRENKRAIALRLLPSGHAATKGGPPLKCVSDGSAGGSRTAAWCVSPIVGDLSCAMLASGTVVRWGRFWKKERAGHCS